MADKQLSIIIAFLATLRIAEFHLIQSKGIFTKPSVKLTHNTDQGLCYLIQNIDFRNLAGIMANIRLAAKKYGATFGCQYWWKPGRINPRLKTVRATIKELEHKKQLIEYRIYLETQIHIG